MSQDKDKIKENNITVTMPVSNPENNNVVSNEVNKEVAKAVFNEQNTSNNGINIVRQELIPKSNPSSYLPMREKMVSKATEFLTAPAIRPKPMETKIHFLRDKGLTDQEIQESINRASSFNQNLYVQNPPHGHYILSNTSGAIQTPYKSQSWFRRLFWQLSVASTIAYIGYQIYKKYIENWLFGKRKSPLEERVEEIGSTVQRCIMILEGKKNTSESLNETTNRPKELDIIRAELKSIKSLLLNRSQFPPAPASSSIPEWQLPKNTKPSTEPQNKVNGIDMQNVLQQSILKGAVNTLPHSPRSTNVKSTVNDDQGNLNDLTPNNQNFIESNDLINNGKDNTNSGDIEQ